MYRDMYPRLRKGTANGMATEQLRQITSTEWINIFRKDDGLPEFEPIDRQKAQEHDKEDSEKSVWKWQYCVCVRARVCVCVCGNLW